MSSTKVKLDATSMRALLVRARATGTVDQWANIACDWMDYAEKCVAEMRATATTREASIQEARELLEEWAYEGHCPHTLTALWLDSTAPDKPRTIEEENAPV